MSKFIYTGFSDEIDENIEKQFAHLNTLGINYFEPRGIDGKNISDLNDEEVEELKLTMKKYNINFKMCLEYFFIFSFISFPFLII